MTQSKTDKLLMYYKIKKLKKTLKVSQIARRLGVSRKTIYFYLSMNEAEFLAWTQADPARKLDLYESFIYKRVNDFPETSGYQMHDWLLEHFPELKVSRRCVSDYVNYIRMKYHIPKPPTHSRQYSQVPEQPYGKQIQVDLGEYKMKNDEGKKLKIHFICFSLARSRFKHVSFQREHFTSETIVKAHELAFEYFGGISEELVYDQDKLMLKDENGGDLLLTATFQAYVQVRKLKLDFCRSADPESKGKIEAVVKYVKSNFLKNRLYRNIGLLNEQGLAWLERTANANVHGTTRKIPAEEFSIEQAYLRPWTPIGIIELPWHPRSIRKDNTISYKSNFYTLPLGSYKGKGSRVEIKAENGQLLIRDMDKKPIAKHPISPDRGKLVRNTNHYRDKEKGIPEKIEALTHCFTDTLMAKEYLLKLKKEKGKYIRDQLRIIYKAVQPLDQKIKDQALGFCYQRKIYSAADFKDVLEGLSKPLDDNISPELGEILNQADPALLSLQPQQSDIQTYENLF